MAAKVDGLEKVQKALRALARKAKRKALRAAVAEPSRQVLRAVKALAPVGKTGLLKRALGRKVKVYTATDTSFAIVGARVGFRAAVGTYTRGERRGQVKYANPTKYLHLVERGTARGVAPRLFIARGEAIAATLAGRAAREVARALSELGGG